jgi:hypothetical protein
MKGFPWLLLFALAAGAGLGILYSWIIAPVQYVDTTPASLRADFKDQLRSVIAASYAATGNLERARARLKELGDTDPVRALSAQAQRMIAQGDSLGTVEEVAQLAEVLGSGAAVQPSTATPPAPALVTPARSQAASIPPALTKTIIPEQVINPPATISSATPRPTRTPTPAPGRPYELVAQDTLCDSELQEGLLQVIVMDARRREVAGAQIIASWDGGEEHFFTGFKPELGDGYADFIMQAGAQYSLRVADGGPPISGVSAPSCTANDGTVTTGQIKLTFQRQ